MCDGEPDRDLFETSIGGVVQEVRERSASGKARAYGEMVGLLWTEGTGQRDSTGGVLERADGRKRVQSLCGYPIDLFSNEGDMEGIHSVLGTHTHLLAGFRSRPAARQLRGPVRR
jgi:hypothetical protein